MNAMDDSASRLATLTDAGRGLRTRLGLLSAHRAGSEARRARGPRR